MKMAPRISPELLRVLAAIDPEDRIIPLSLAVLADRAMVPVQMMRNALGIGVASGIIRVREATRKPRRYLIEVVSSAPWSSSTHEE